MLVCRRGEDMMRFLCVLYTVLLVSACSGPKISVDENTIKTEIADMLHTQDGAWNRGDIPAFMEDYIKSDDLRFASGGTVQRGWQGTLDRYLKRYPDRAAMGKLAFTDMEIDVLSDNAAMVFARWELTREHDKPGGLFTLLVKKINGKWVIVSDHTSSNASTDPVTTDPLTIDPEFPPTSVELDFNSHGSALNGHFYLANGAGPHPTVIMLHGFPGYEKNLDIAQAIRRAGFNVLFFHYRGAWGSAGDFSLTHVIEDALAASEFVRSDKAVKDYRIDPEHISFIGHSMGGFAALAAGAKDKNVHCVAGISAADYGIRGSLFTDDKARAGFAAYVDAKHLLGNGPLRGVSGRGMLAEIDQNEQAFSVRNMAGEYSGRSVFLAAAKNDTVLPPAVYHKALVEGYAKNPEINLTSKIFEGDHSYSWRRIELTRDVVTWLNGNCR